MPHYSFIEIALTFLFYGFLGWCYEVIVMTIIDKRFVNSGFLNGPICPIYGFGALGVLFTMPIFSNNFILTFFGSVVLTTVLEFITGFILEKSFHQKWWDYSDKPFNIMGYVCLSISLLWGLVCLLLIYVAQPAFLHVISYIPSDIKLILVVVFSILVITDLVITVSSLFRIKIKLRRLEDIGSSIRSISDSIGQSISDRTMATVNKSDDTLKELNDLKTRYQFLLDKQILGYKRLAKAFPGLRFEKLKKISQYKRKKNKKA